MLILAAILACRRAGAGVPLKFNSRTVQDVWFLFGPATPAWPHGTVPIFRAAFPEIRAPFCPMGSPCQPRGALQFVLNPQPSSPSSESSHATTAQMQSPDHGTAEDALYDRIRTAKNAAFRLAAKMAPRFANQFSIFKDVLNMDDMSG